MSPAEEVGRQRLRGATCQQAVVGGKPGPCWIVYAADGLPWGMGRDVERAWRDAVERIDRVGGPIR